MLSISISNLTPPHKLSSLVSIYGGPHGQFLPVISFPQLSLTKLPNAPFKTTIIRMGGGPRTYPGGVSKWQWKRMQAKKAKQLLKARLARERQIYEMRKRAELKAAVSELERPWEVVEKAPTLFSVSADEQLKVLADRFQKPGGFDMWSERDGPELFKTENGLYSARYFPKGVVHSIKPYSKVEKFDDGSDKFKRRDANVNSGRRSEGEGDRNRGVEGPGVGNKYAKVKNGMFNAEKNLSSISEKKFKIRSNESNKGNGAKDKFRNSNHRRNSLSGSNSTGTGSFRGKNERNNRLSSNVIDSSRRNGKKNVEGAKPRVFDLTLQQDGSYELEREQIMKRSFLERLR